MLSANLFLSLRGIWPFLAWLLFLLEDLKSHCLYWCGLSPLCDLLATLLLPLDQVVPVLHQGGQLALTFGKCQHRLLFGLKASSLSSSQLNCHPLELLLAWRRRRRREQMIPCCLLSRTSCPLSGSWCRGSG